MPKNPTPVNYGSPYGNRVQKERFIIRLLCVRLNDIKSRYPAARAAIDDLLNDLIVVTIDDDD